MKILPAHRRLTVFNFWPSLLWLAVFLAAALETNLYAGFFYREAVARLRIEQPVAHADELHAAVMAYYRHQGGLPANEFTGEELAHLIEVRTWLDAVRMAGGAACALLLLGMLSPARWLWMRGGARTTMALLLALALLGSHWVLFERATHPLLFAGKWDFHPSSLLVKLYPYPFLIAAGLCVAGTVFGMAVCCGVLARFLVPRDEHAGESHGTWGMVLLLPASAALAYPVWHAGYAMTLELERGTLTYYGIALFTLLSCCVLVFSRRKLPGLVMCLAAFGLLTVFAGGVAGAYRKADRTAREGQAIVNAIEAYRRGNRGFLPESLEVLTPYYLEQLPPVPVGEKQWHYEAVNMHYTVWFVGPLKAIWQYDTVTKQWKFPPAPASLFAYLGSHEERSPAQSPERPR